MVEHECVHSLDELRGELGAWKAHIERYGLSERLRFIAWLSKSLDSHEFALIIDSEMDRSALKEAYLFERYGPAG